MIVENTVLTGCQRQQDAFFADAGNLTGKIVYSGVPCIQRKAVCFVFRVRGIQKTEVASLRNIVFPIYAVDGIQIAERTLQKAAVLLVENQIILRRLKGCLRIGKGLLREHIGKVLRLTFG